MDESLGQLSEELGGNKQKREEKEGPAAFRREPNTPWERDGPYESYYGSLICFKVYSFLKGSSTPGSFIGGLMLH